MDLPTENEAGQLLAQDLTLIGLVYRCADDVFDGLGVGAPGERITVVVPGEYGCWYARAQYATTGLVSEKSESVTTSRPPCLGCHMQE